MVRRSVLITLAAIMGLVPLASDMYLASLPELGREFDAPVWLTQLTLTGYLLLLGLGQLFAGPISDALGRRRPLAWGLLLFIAGAVLATVAPTMAVLIVARVLQGLGGAMAMVVANSSVRDRSRGDEATGSYAVLMTVAAVAPIIAPTLGGFLDQLFGWRSVFATLALLGVVVAVACRQLLSESLPREQRTRSSARTVVAGYLSLLRLTSFRGPLLAFAALFTVLFAYIGGASYVYQDTYGLSPVQFGIVFGGAGLALIGGALIARLVATRLGSMQLAMLGIACVLLGSLWVLISVAVQLPIAAVVTGVVIVIGGLGLGEPALMGIAMSAVSESAGSAAALLGAAQFIAGAAITAVGGSIAVASPTAWAATMVVCASFALLIGKRNLHSDTPGSSAQLSAISSTADNDVARTPFRR